MSQETVGFSIRKFVIISVLICAFTGCSVNVRRQASARVAEPPVFVAMPPAEFPTALLQAFANHALNMPFRNMLPVRASEQMFPSAFQLETVGLTAYARLPDAERKNDLYLFSPLDNYWPSDYYVNDVRIPFTCGFIVQVLPFNGGSQIQVYEYQPIVVAGKRWLFGHSGPGRYLDIRQVDPTVEDRNALLREIRRVLR